jgi:hypothetical protein
MTIAGEQGETDYGSATPEVILQIADEVPSEHRDAIRESVRTLARRSAETSKRAVEHSTTQTEQMTAMARPLHRLIEADADASEALAASNRRIEEYRPDTPTQEPGWPTVKLIEGKSLATELDFVASQVFGAPWHYQWQWHNGQPPTTSSQDRTNGQIRMAVHADQNHNWSDVHGGFGVVLRTDRVQAVAGRSLRRTDHAYFVHAGALGGNATVEGGMEMTALEDGRLLAFAQDKRFRKRLTNGERETLGFHGWTTGEGIEVNWVMLPGRTYTFNVGAWVFGEAHGGVGTASIASAQVNALVIALTAQFTD